MAVSFVGAEVMAGHVTAQSMRFVSVAVALCGIAKAVINTNTQSVASLNEKVEKSADCLGSLLLGSIDYLDPMVHPTVAKRVPSGFDATAYRNVLSERERMAAAENPWAVRISRNILAPAERALSVLDFSRKTVFDPMARCRDLKVFRSKMEEKGAWHYRGGPSYE